MEDFKKKRKIDRFIQSRFGKFLMVAAFLLMVYPLLRVYMKNKEASEMKEGVNKEVAELQARKDYLESEINRLKTNLGKEEEVKKKFNVSRPDEEMIIITDKQPAAVCEAAGEEKSFWQKIKDWF